MFIVSLHAGNGKFCLQPTSTQDDTMYSIPKLSKFLAIVLLLLLFLCSSSKECANYFSIQERAGEMSTIENKSSSKFFNCVLLAQKCIYTKQQGGLPAQFFSKQATECHGLSNWLSTTCYNNSLLRKVWWVSDPIHIFSASNKPTKCLSFVGTRLPCKTFQIDRFTDD